MLQVIYTIVYLKQLEKKICSEVVMLKRHNAIRILELLTLQESKRVAIYQ